MYMYKTSISQSVWEGAHLGVSTFLTNSIKCTQGWILYLVRFFFTTTPYEFLDMKNNKKLYKHTSHKPIVDVKKVLGLPSPCSGGCPSSAHAGGSWSQRPEISPQNRQTFLDLTAGMVGGFSCCFHELSHRISSMIHLQQVIFMSEFSSSYLMGSSIFVWKWFWNTSELEWCRKLWQNVWTLFRSLDISVLPEMWWLWLAVI